MAAHRYWRVVYPETWGAGALEISEIHLLLDTTRVDSPATLTSNVAPTVGALANLKDDDTSTAVTWAAGLVRNLTLNWDFGGSPQDVNDMRVGSADSQSTMLYSARLQSSDDGLIWAEELHVFAISYPGARAKTLSEKLAFTPYDISTNLILQAGKQSIAYGGTTSGSARGVTARSSGVYQLEFQVSGSFIGASVGVGIASTDAPLSFIIGSSSTGYSVAYRESGQRLLTGAISAYGASYISGDVIGVVCDFAAGTVTFYKNGVSQGSIAAALTGKTVYPGAGLAGSLSLAVTLRTSGFTYPIAGAAAWDTRQVIKSEMNGGRAIGLATPLIDSAAQVSLYKVQGVTIPRLRRDMNWNFIGQGIGRLKGTTKDTGTPNIPVSERVRLFRQKDGLLMREVWSTPGTGAYSFDYIDELDTYFVVSFDHDLNFRAVVADNLTLANGGVELIA